MTNLVSDEQGRVATCNECDHNLKVECTYIMFERVKKNTGHGIRVQDPVRLFSDLPLKERIRLAREQVSRPDSDYRG